MPIADSDFLERLGTSGQHLRETKCECKERGNKTEAEWVRARPLAQHARGFELKRYASLLETRYFWGELGVNFRLH